MKLKFKAKGHAPSQYDINGTLINGIDMSLLPEGGQFVGDETTQEAGIYGAEYIDGELVVTLAQTCIAYETPAYSSDWRGDPDLLIDAENYDPDTCYIVATAKPDGAEYVKRDAGWTVAMTQEVDDELV